MIVTLICEDRLYDVLLPEKTRGQFWMEDDSQETTSLKRKIFAIEAINGNWQVRSDKRLKLYENGKEFPSDKIILETGQLYLAVWGKEEVRRGYIFVEDYTEDRCTFKKYQIVSNAIINIGKDETNEIRIDNPYISSLHAQLTFQNGKMTIVDNHSTNGVYIDRKRVKGETVLRPGDVIYILGFKIVVGNCFIAMNNPDHTISICADVLQRIEIPEVVFYEAPDEENEKIYCRSPRFKREITMLELSIDPPTMKEDQGDTPLMLTLAPSLVMGCASFSSGIVTMNNTLRNGGNISSSIPTLIMSLSMLCGMVLFPFIMKIRDKKQRKEREQARKNKYLKYLDNIRAEIYKASSKQKEILIENFPYILTMMTEPKFYETLLWSRVYGQSDFLTIRVGIGNVPVYAELKFPDQRFSIDDDSLRTQLNAFSEEKKIIENVPIAFSLVENRIAGIIGNSNVVEGMLNNILLQIAALHSYDEVKVVFLCEEKDLYKYNYVRWMQHCWDNENNKRYLATNPEEVRELSAYFSKVISTRSAEKKQPFPHYLIISTSRVLSDRCAFISDILADNTIEGFSYLAVYDELKNLPKECSIVVQLYDKQGVMFHKKSVANEKVVFVQDTVSSSDAEKHVMDIAEYKLDLQSGKYTLPGMITFLEMFHTGKIEHLNIATRWKENNPVTTLQTPIGIDAAGGTFYLDLHEKAHGPHGLVAGMTGSGKSEFIITYILSLAVNYHPDEVAFILIDYKGGGLTGAFENEKYRLPHLAGTITNLDGASITRSLLSIQSELRRRQTIFNEARRVANEGTMDIYKYQKLYRNGVVKEAVPHLFIISDEFAELKTQQPEFMTQLISTARIGRSLGVHLILATQKPNGVVNEQIWANSRFKICLKVQDRADSMDMLKRPDAAELIETGRFYLQVGYNELFEMGQSAWCGAPYVPTDHVEKDIDERVQLIDHQGNIIEETKPKKKVKETDDNAKQIVEIMKYINQIAEEEHASAKALWLPEIPAIITVDGLREKYHYSVEDPYALDPIVGELDDPFNQCQSILTVPLTECGNAICYGAVGSGKANFLTTLIYSLYQDHTSETLHTYILDFGAETLRMFEQAPQTGDFMIAGDDEKLKNLFLYLKREMDRRKKIFTEYGGEFISYCRLSKEKVPSIVVVINNYSNFAEQYEIMDEQLTILSRDCSKYGIYFVVTCASTIGIRHKLLQNFTQTYVLQLNDKMDYISTLGNTGGVYPSRIFGRGIIKKTDTYEYQTAHVIAETDHVAEYVKAYCKKLNEESGLRKAFSIPVLPKMLYQNFFADKEVSYHMIPIGLEVGTMEICNLDLTKHGVIPILAMDRNDITFFAEGIASLMCDSTDLEVYIFDPGQQLSIDNIDKEHYIIDNFEQTIVTLFQMTVERHNAYKLNDGRVPKNMDMHPIVILVNGVGMLKEQLSEDGISKLRLMMEKTHGKLNLAFMAADDYQSSNRYCTENWCNGNGLWIGNGITDQIRLKFNRREIIVNNSMDCSNGYLIEKNQIKAVKLLISDRMQLEE